MDEPKTFDGAEGTEVYPYLSWCITTNDNVGGMPAGSRIEGTKQLFKTKAEARNRDEYCREQAAQL